MNRLNTTLLLIPFCCVSCFCVSCFAEHASADDKLKVLIVDGQNNHVAWPKTTMMMRSALEDTGRFTVDIQRTQFTWNGGELMKEFPLNDGKQYKDLPKPKTDPDFKPNFSNYDVVLNNFGYKAAPWPDETKAALEAFVGGGGALVIVHSASNCFPGWKAFNEMTGLGGWDGRDEKSGPYVYLNDQKEEVRDEKPGAGGDHGPKHSYQVVIRDPQHSIMKGLPQVWMHTKDELYQKLRGPADNMTILATAYANPKYKGTGRHEPMVMTIDYKDGRVFHTAMGHDAGAMACAGYLTLLVRGTEWAATGEVTLTDVPEDFPTQNKTSSRQFQVPAAH
jgi:hypothetical protein